MENIREALVKTNMTGNKNIPGIAFLTCGDGKRVRGEIYVSTPISGFYNPREMKVDSGKTRFTEKKNRGGKSQWLIY